MLNGIFIAVTHILMVLKICVVKVLIRLVYGLKKAMACCRYIHRALFGNYQTKIIITFSYPRSMHLCHFSFLKHFEHCVCIGHV